MKKAIQRLLQRLKDELTPLIDGNQAVFVWQGGEAPFLIGDFCNWENGEPFKMEEEEPGIWLYRMELPSDAYMEYAYWDGEEHHLDPFNPKKVSNGMGKFNHYFYMPEGRPTDLTYRHGNIPHGVVTSHRLPTELLLAGKERQVYFYQPPVPDAVPLILVWDGKDYLQRARLPMIVDNLIARGRINPIALALVENGQGSRSAEYACSEATIGFLLQCLFPRLHEHLNLVDPDEQPGAWGVMGASLGGLMALYTALRMPEVFGHVLSQSGAFNRWGFDSIVYDLIERPAETQASSLDGHRHV